MFFIEDYRYMRRLESRTPLQAEFLCREINQTENNIMDDSEEFCRIPKYKYTRVVTMKEVVLDDKDHTVLSCSCDHFISRRCFCRHMYCVLDNAPKKSTFTPTASSCMRLHMQNWAARISKHDAT